MTRAEEITEYINTHKGCTQTELRRVYNISDFTLKKMEREDRRCIPKPLDEFEQFDTIERLFQKLRNGELEWDGKRYVIMSGRGEYYEILPGFYEPGALG